MNTAEAAAQVGLPAKTIRYYEDLGLVRPARRPNGYRDFQAADIHALRFLQRARSLGFSVEDCRHLLSLYQDKARPSSEVRRLAEAHLTEIRGRIAALEGLKATLERLCEACRGDERPDCPILDELAEAQPPRRPRRNLP